MKKGDVVLYVDKFDADESDGSPNVSPAIVTEVNKDGTLDLAVFFLNGLFYKNNAKEGLPEERGTWHVKE